MSDIKTASRKPSLFLLQSVRLGRLASFPTRSAPTADSEALELSGHHKKNEPLHCPHCGKPLVPVPSKIAGYTFGIGFVQLPDGRYLETSPLFMRVLEILFHHKGQVTRKTLIYDTLYGQRIDGGPSAEVIPVIITRLREITRHFDLPITIQTFRGVGYKLTLRGEAS